MAAQPEHRYCTIFSAGIFCGAQGQSAHDCCKGCYGKLNDDLKGGYAIFHEKHKGAINTHYLSGSTARPDAFFNADTGYEQCISGDPGKVAFGEAKWKEGFAAGFAAGVEEGPSYELTEKGKAFLKGNLLKGKGGKGFPY